MKYEKLTVNAGVFGPKSYDILRGMPTDNPKIGIYLLGSQIENNDSEYSLWNIESLTLEGKNSSRFWPYKGEDYEVLMKQLMEDFVAHGLDNL